MPDAIKIAVIAACSVAFSGLVAAIAAIFGAIYSKKNRDAIQEVHLSLNSRLDQLIAASHSRGAIEERDNQRAVEIRATEKAANLKP